MNLVRCWGCGHIGYPGDPDGLCPACQGIEVAEAACAGPVLDLERERALEDEIEAVCLADGSGVIAAGPEGLFDLGPLFGGLS